MHVLMAASLFLFALGAQEPDKRIRDLEKERGKLARENDPVDRTKLQIKISEILLTLISDAVHGNDLAQMEQRLTEYTAAIRDAHRTMMSTGRDAHDKPKGFKDLEIALRRQVRQLEDLGGLLTFDVRDPVDRAKDEATAIRDDLMKALFGVQSAASGS